MYYLVDRMFQSPKTLIQANYDWVYLSWVLPSSRLQFHSIQLTIAYLKQSSFWFLIFWMHWALWVTPRKSFSLYWCTLPSNFKSLKCTESVSSLPMSSFTFAYVFYSNFDYLQYSSYIRSFRCLIPPFIVLHRSLSDWVVLYVILRPYTFRHIYQIQKQGLT